MNLVVNSTCLKMQTFLLLLMSKWKRLGGVGMQSWLLWNGPSFSAAVGKAQRNGMHN